MLSIPTLRTLIRRTYVLKVNGCGQRYRENCIQAAVNKVGKMLQTFEDRVFQQIDRKYNSSIDYDKKISPDNKYYQINNKTVVNNEENIYQEYEEAVKALNALQSNAESLRSSIHKRKRLNSLQDTQRYLLKSGLTIKDLEKLSYIHVTGTKGKLRRMFCCV
ncbi:uncharacterized protein LOC124418726 [Lucilia cuprina]|uniref:uncharacterized protein LOC124418726 n=1 Tax=Lucilia cuprina TaxID=7375 RepID=UPI001F051206|nr:uncharacterized protein LOC124418726 [Lucilia cuprina]